MDGILSSINGIGEMFCDPKTRGVTGVVDDKTALFVFEQGSTTDLWSDPALGMLITARPVQNAFMSRVSIRGVTDVGYRASRGHDGVLRHHLVLFDKKRTVIRRLDNIVGLRKEQ